jgi:SpoVK/Ycf46/Vps4 family AAA+-type ATPase
MAENKLLNGKVRKQAAPLVDAKGILISQLLPDKSLDSLWESIFIPSAQKDQLLSQAVLNFTLRPKVDRAKVPLHGVILLVGSPGTGKTSLARGLASRTADSLKSSLGDFAYVEVEPHALASSSLGRSQKAVQELLGQTISELAGQHPLIVLLDEVETLAADRTRMSLEANPIDVHRATDAVLAQLDHLAEKHSKLLFIATSNFPEAIDQAFMSRADLILTIALPEQPARKTIFKDTLEELAKPFHKITSLITDTNLEKLAKLSDGLDGRRIRKAVISACAFDKHTALDLNRLNITDLEKAVSQAGRANQRNGMK